MNEMPLNERLVGAMFLSLQEMVEGVAGTAGGWISRLSLELLLRWGAVT